MKPNFIIETVDVEIKIGVHSQRAQAAESWAERNLLNGPTEGAVKGKDLLSTPPRRACVSCREYVGILRKRIKSDFMKQSGTAGNFNPSLTI